MSSIEFSLAHMRNSAPDWAGRYCHRQNETVSHAVTKMGGDEHNENYFEWVWGSSSRPHPCNDDWWFGTTAALAQEWEPEFDGAVLLPLSDGFPSKPITIVAAGDAKSVTGRLAHQLANYSSLFRNKSVVVNAEYKPEFEALGNWEALKYAASADGGDDGHVVVVFSSPDDILDLHVNPDAKDLGVGLDDLSEVLSIEDHRYAVAQCKDAGWDPTWEALVQQIKDNPGEVTYAGGEPGDRLDMTFAHYMKDQGIGNLYDGHRSSTPTPAMLARVPTRW